MAIICPTVLAGSKPNYNEQIRRVTEFSKRVQIDLMDGVFAPHKSVGLDEVWWPEGIKADIHLMYQDPMSQLDRLIFLRPSLVIVHAEADGNFFELADTLKEHGIKVGLCLLQRTSVADVYNVLNDIDHLLIFSGDLGSFGGHANLGLLQKAHAAKKFRAQLEVGWDGGVDEKNAAKLISGGVDVLNVGGYIHRAADPHAAYKQLVQAITQNSKT